MEPLSQDQLRAFAAVAQCGSFTGAARELHLSQPALSRRVGNLEERLQTTLFVRGPSEVALTEAGYRLLKFVQSQQALEQELLFDLMHGDQDIGGTIRIGGLSSIVQPIVVPGLAPFLRANPMVQVEFDIVDEAALPRHLRQGSLDFVITGAEISRSDVHNILLGYEEFVVIESRKHSARNDVFLDTNHADHCTDWYFHLQPPEVRRPDYRRSFLHDEPGILLGVELGLGRAVKPRHTLKGSESSVRVSKRFVPVRRPVYLQFREQRFYARVHQLVRDELVTHIRHGLGKTANSPAIAQ